MSKIVVIDGHKRLDHTEERERAAATDWVPRLGPDTRDLRDPETFGVVLLSTREQSGLSDYPLHRTADYVEDHFVVLDRTWKMRRQIF